MAGRKPIGDRAMTPAERKARERLARTENLDAALHCIDQFKSLLRGGDVEAAAEMADLAAGWVLAARSGDTALYDALNRGVSGS